MDNSRNFHINTNTKAGYFIYITLKITLQFFLKMLKIRGVIQRIVNCNNKQGVASLKVSYSLI